MVAAEFSEARRIDQQPDVGLLRVQQVSHLAKALCIAKIQSQRAHRDGNLRFQGFQRIHPAGNDPDLIDLYILGQLQHKLPAHAGAGTGDNGNIHTYFLLSLAA